MRDRELLTAMFNAAVKAADPEVAIAAHLPPPPSSGRTVVVGAGKGAAQMAAALERLWPEPLTGLVITRYGYGCDTRSIKILEAAHPVPDAAGLAGARQLFELIKDLEEGDLVIALVCGGASALLPSPPEGLTLDDEIALNEMLLASGAPISAMNTIRKHFSGIKGGRLAAATKARVATLIVSDIPGDNPAFVGSGPTVPDQTTRMDAQSMIEQYGISLPAQMAAHLASSRADALDPADAVFARNTVSVIASAGLSLEAAASVAQTHGLAAHILSDSIEGEARDVANVHAALAREIAERNRPFAKPCVLISGGETTVTLRAKGGRGGRNGEFALAAALGLQGIQATLLAADTDGIDGSENNAGAFVDGSTVQRLREGGLDARQILSRNDSYTAFDRLGDLFITGPTGTNVNDLRAIILR